MAPEKTQTRHIPRSRKKAVKRQRLRLNQVAGKDVHLRILRPAVVHPFPLPKLRIAKQPASIKKCRIPLCRIHRCNLRTHQSYRGELVDRSKTSAATTTVPSDTNTSKSKSPVSTEDNITLQIQSGGVDGLPALPLDERYRTIYLSLFHHYFTEQYDRINRIMIPPPGTVLQKQNFFRNKDRSFITALSAPIFCLHACASSHYQIFFRKDSCIPDAVTTLLQWNLTALLRDKLNNIEQEPTDFNDVILVMLILVMFETSTKNYSALQAHRQGMIYIVRRQGGLHNMSRRIPYVLLLDRLVAIFLARPPLLSPFPDRAIRRPLRYPHVYGAYFETVTSKNDNEKSVYEFCLDACRTIELMEKEGPSFNPKVDIGSEHPDLHYLFFLKTNLAAQFAYLNAAAAEKTSLDAQFLRCILLAAKLVDYAVLQDNYMVSLVVYCADNARAIIEELDVARTEHLPVLTWVLFVLTSLSSDWAGRDWALQHLQKCLDLKYGRAVDDAVGEVSIWPADWKRREYDHVRTFVWSDRCFATGFLHCCRDLEKAILVSQENALVRTFLTNDCITEVESLEGYFSVVP